MSPRYVVQNNDVAVIGIGFRAPSGSLSKSISNTNQLWDSLVNGFDGIAETSERWSDNYIVNGDIVSKYAGLIPLDEWKSFDPIFFGINPSDEHVNTIDPQQRLLLKCTWEALEDSGIDPLTLRGSNTSTFIGSSTEDYDSTIKSPFETQNNIFGSSSHSLANRVSYCFDFRGESMTIDTACSSSLNAIHLGYKTIKYGQSDVSIVGGVNLILDPNISKSFSHLSMLSPTGKCHTFSSDADGYVRSECVGVVILKNLKQAIKDGNNIYCVIKGSNSNVDGNYDKSNFYSPSKSSQYENIKTAIESTNGQINESDIDYVECHGTGTLTGDPIELEGISRVFKDTNKQVLIGSIKSNIGHGEASSGVMSFIKCCVMYKNQSFVQNINFKSPNPAIKFDEWRLKVVTEPTPFNNNNKNTVMAINNFGITECNRNIIKNENSINKKYLIPFSSNSSISLDRYKQIIMDQSDTLVFNEFVNNQIKFKSISLVQRTVIIASNWKEFKDSKNEIKSSNINTLSNISVKNNNPFTVFVFCGQGSQYNRMALELYENDTIFKQWVDKFDSELLKYYGYSVLQKLRSIDDNDTKSVHDHTIAQPSNIMIQVSLFELYKHWGIKSDLIVGHSLGEISASYCSGMIDFETLCYLVYHRSVAQNKTTGTGRMLSVNISAEEYLSNYSSKYPTVDISCYNSPSSIVLSGKEHLLNEIVDDLKSKNIFCVMLGTLSSLHTSSQLVIKDEICSMNTKSKQSTTPIFSTVTTNLFNHETTPFNSEYIFENVLQPVRFTQTISNIYKYIEENNYGNEVTFIEIAPHPTLSFYLNQMKSTQSLYFNNGEKITIHSPLHKKKNDYNEFLNTISTLYVYNSFNINFKSQLKQNYHNYIHKSLNKLPLYQWDDKMYFKKNSTYEKIKKEGPPIHHLGVTNDSPSKSYQTFLDTNKKPFQWLKGHQVKSKYYFPGCGYIINLFNIYPNQDITISSIEFKTPLILQDDFNQCLQTTINTLSKNEFNVKSHFKDTTTNQWVLCSTGNFSLFKHGNEINRVNIDEIRNGCNFTKISKSELYESIKIKTGLTYKGLFQGVKECYVGDNCSLSIVSLNEIQNQNEFNHLLNNDTMKSFFNTAILDTCLHGILVFIKHQCQIVLDKIEGLKYYSSNIPSPTDQQHSEIYVYSEMKSRISLYSYSGSIQIMLNDGTLLIEISNVICTSHTPIIDNTTIIPPPSNEIYLPIQQSKDSIINKPQSFKHLCQLEELGKDEIYQQIISKEHLLTLFYYNINQRRPNINRETLSTIDYIQFKQLYQNDEVNENYFFFIFDILKQYNSLGINKQLKEFPDGNNDKYIKLLEKTSQVMAKQIFPLEKDDPNIDNPQSLFEDGLLDQFYQKSNVIKSVNNFLSDIVSESIKPIINEPIVFRILEFGGGVGSLSILVLNKINKLLNDNPTSNIDIEYTWSDISASFFSDIKEKLSKIKGVNIIYRTLDLDKSLKDQDLKELYYDMIIMSNVLHVVKQLRFSLNEIHNILTPNGQIIFIEPPYKSIYSDSVFGVFPQWWPSPEDIDIRKDRSCMKIETWYKLLNECNYKDTTISGNDNASFLIQTRKSNIYEMVLSNIKSMKQFTSHDNIILFGNSKEGIQISESFKSNQQLFSKIIQMDNFNELNNWIIKSIDSIRQSKTLIIFMKAIDPLDINNFKEITLEYIQINQMLLQLEIENFFKHVLILLNSTTNNYLSSSINGSARYFAEFPQLDLYSLDFDNISMQNENILSLIDILINPTTNIQKEFTIKNNTVYYERYKKQTKIKQSFTSKSFETNKDNLMIQLDPNLEYVLKTKKQKLQPNEIEVQIKGTGINYKDYLMYIGQISNSVDIKYGKEEEIENGLNQMPNIGNDFSGIITRCGSGVKKFIIGDEVFGVASKTSGSHIIIDYRYVYYKPSNISHVQAASIPSVYVTSLHSIYYTGNLQSDQTILIHSAAGGVGLSALELLRGKQHKGYIFLTVGSKDKEEYLLDRYGSFITGIYSSRNKNYVHQIKEKLKQLQCDKYHQGVDLILNTLSSEYMDSNFQCLNTCGRIVDLSITHLTPNDYMTNNHFKYNYGYNNVELVDFPGSLFESLLKKVVKMFNSNELEQIPIIEYSNDQFKDAIEYINERQHIGKIVINHDIDMLSRIFNEQKQSDSIIMKKSFDISRLDIGKNILVTGQTGIILEIMKWIVKYSNKSIDNIIILSKSPLKWELELLINQTKHQKDNTINFHFNQIDIEDRNKVHNVLNNLESNSNITNIDTVIHFAFVTDICDVQDVNINRLNITHGAKTIGAINLHNESIQRSWKIKQFIMASSSVSIIGSNRQCCYVSACNTIDSLSKYRKSIGLPSLSINLGAISSTGFVSRNDAIETMFHSSTFKFISPQLILSSLDLFIQDKNNYSNYCLTDFYFENMVSLKSNFNLIKFDYQTNNVKIINKSNDYSNSNENIKYQLLNKISELLSIESSKINLEFQLNQYGLDSLVIVQLKNWVDSQFGFNLISIQQLQNNKLSQSLDIIIKGKGI
ncbi:hypothetical protein DICPUDRAFT_153476 [Dictyostelium purpureum]|uniref:Uncharacterized protein n=1 Tax=Dictyostelium purpureum TaxID=5786 RepID=F0ZP07_DICPU|nr:uncharacterized protein DICPUDRAFT_153476 [Dictyostelium purpureum]EGC34314.1 hypothetical protein DICPUDRAFT_153476 [Dictyostelium purpureum]|eukprot:XP_003289150.1 hypothetical protein DICPUDRAFT_153476 [Dictyostelium purpureum]